MVHFVGAGPGAPDLITVRGERLLREADVIIYAGSLVNPALLELAKEDCLVRNSAKMTLEEVILVMEEAEREKKTTVRLHTGDPCLYGAIREQMDLLEERGIAYDTTPGVSSFCGAAAAMQLEYTLPGQSQSLIITRMAGRTPVPERESIGALSSHQTSMVIFLSAGLSEEVQEELLRGGYAKDTPCAIVYKASWPQERVYPCTVGSLAQTAKKERVTKTALILVGQVLAGRGYDRSRLYAPDFSTEYRRGSKDASLL